MNIVTQHFGWRLLHVALQLWEATVTWWRAAGLQSGAARCGLLFRCACSVRVMVVMAWGMGSWIPYRTVVFLHCPVVQPAVAWL
jgi:hypothetical protein